MRRLTEWMRRTKFPQSGVELGAELELWNLDVSHYETAEPLRERLRALGRSCEDRDLYHYLTRNQLTDVVIAAGGVEYSVERVRGLATNLLEQVSLWDVTIPAEHDVGIQTLDAVKLALTVSEVLFWVRSLVDRVQRRGDRRRGFGEQGLLPALAPGDLKSKVAQIFQTLCAGEVGEARWLRNLTAHSSTITQPFGGLSLSADHRLLMPFPDRVNGHLAEPVLFTWEEGRDGFDFIENVWTSVQIFVDALLGEFESGVPERPHRQLAPEDPT